MPMSGIYWTDFAGGVLHNIDPNLSVQSIIVSGIDFPKSFNANATDGKFYIAADEKIYRCNFDGSNLETIVVKTDLPTPNAYPSFQTVVIDEVGEKLYFNDAYYGRIAKVGLDGSGLEIIYDAGADPGFGHHRGMTIDHVNEYVYWSVDRPAGHPAPADRSIYRIDYNGAGFTTVAHRNDDQFPFIGIFLDVSNQNMYWCNYTGAIVESSGLGSGSTTIVASSTGPYFISPDILNDKVYWYDNTDDVIYCDDIGGGNLEAIVSGINAGGFLFVSRNYESPSQPSTSETPLRIIHHLTRTGDYNPQLIGSFDVGIVSANIRVWDIVDGVNILVDIANSGCYQIGNTDKWGWSTEYLPFASGIHNYHYYYEMVSDTYGTDYGEFFLTVPERGRWAYP